MNEAPKKIWWRVDGPLIGWTEIAENSHPNDIPYIRADLVDDLVEALEEAAELFESSSEGVGVNFYQCAKDARAALARVKDE